MSTQHIQACDEAYLWIWEPSTLWGSVANFCKYTDGDLEEDDTEDESILEGTQDKQIGFKRKRPTVDVSSSLEKRVKSSGSYFPAVRETFQNFDNSLSQTAQAVESTQGHYFLLSTKNVDLDYSTPPPNFPLVPISLGNPEPDIKGSKGYKPRASQGDAYLLTIMDGGKNSDIAAKAGNELLASDDEEENLARWALKPALMPAIRVLRETISKAVLKMRGRKEIGEDDVDWIKEQIGEQSEKIEEWTHDEIEAFIEKWIETGVEE